MSAALLAAAGQISVRVVWPRAAVCDAVVILHGSPPDAAAAVDPFVWKSVDATRNIKTSRAPTRCPAAASNVNQS